MFTRNKTDKVLMTMEITVTNSVMTVVTTVTVVTAVTATMNVLITVSHTAMSIVTGVTATKNAVITASYLAVTVVLGVTNSVNSTVTIPVKSDVTYSDLRKSVTIQCNSIQPKGIR